MTFAIAILGLAVLIFIHELGHFVVSLILGMRPRRFYVGFPPAIWSVNRNGIEYGIGAIPLGGFVKIPGMHRPAVADVDVAFGLACDEAPGLAGSVARLRQSIADENGAASSSALSILKDAIEGKTFSPAAQKAVDRGVEDIGDALGPDAYWRAATWKRVAAIAAGPIANILLAFVLFTGLFMNAGGPATTTVSQVNSDAPAESMGLKAGDQIVSINGVRLEADQIAPTINSSGGELLSVVVRRDGQTVPLPPTRAVLSDGRYRLGFLSASEGLGVLPAAKEA